MRSPATYIKIELFTLKNPMDPQILDNKNLTVIGESYYDPKLPTRIFIHGWSAKGEFKSSLTEGSLVFCYYYILL